jgi:hypothetical protein
VSPPQPIIFTFATSDLEEGSESFPVSAIKRDCHLMYTMSVVCTDAYAGRILFTKCIRTGILETYSKREFLRPSCSEQRGRRN